MGQTGHTVSCTNTTAFRARARPAWRVLALTGMLLPAASPSHAGQGYILSGIGGGGKDTFDAYQGIIYAPFGSLSETGLIVRGWSKAFRFTYNTSLPGIPSAQISALGMSLEAEAGWQYAKGPLRVAAFAGLVWRDHFLTPNDPGSNLSKSRFGFSATIDGQYKLTDNFGIMANGSFLQGFNQYWAEMKPYYQMQGGWKVGADFAGFGGKGYNTTRAGIFFSDYEFSLWSKKRLFLGGQAGAQFSFENNRVAPYIGLNAGYLF